MVKTGANLNITSCCTTTQETTIQLKYQNHQTPQNLLYPNCNTHQNLTQGVFFRVVPIKLYGHGTSVHKYAFIDEGSSITLIEDDLAKKLKINGTPQQLCLKWTSDTV